MIIVDKGATLFCGKEIDILAEVLTLCEALHNKGITSKIVENTNFSCEARLLQKACERISYVFNPQEEPAQKWQRMRLRAFEMRENIEDFEKFVRQLEKLGLVHILNVSGGYKNRDSEQERKYFTLEFLAN